MSYCGVTLTYIIDDRLFDDVIVDRYSIAERIKLVAAIAELIAPGCGYTSGYHLTRWELDLAEESFGSELWFKIGDMVMGGQKVHFNYIDNNLLGIIENGGS